MKLFFKSFIAVTIFCVFSPVSFAAVSITEIMYDLDGADIDWVEVYNPDSASIDPAALKLLISNSTSNHGISKYAGSTLLSSGSYGVIVASSTIANFTAKWGSAGNIFTSSFTLPNTSGKIEINNGDKNISLDSVEYASTEGASGDGNSLQKDSFGKWVAATPTPGSVLPVSQTLANTTSISSSTDSVPSSSTSDIQSSNQPVSGGASAPVEPQIFASAGKDKIVVVGAQITFEGRAYGLKKEPLENARFLWNFGDGTTGEGKMITHTYRHPGNYITVLDVSSGYFSGSDRLNVRADPSPLSISSISDGSGYFIEISNKSNADIDISFWSLALDEKIFVIPKNTFVTGGKKLAFLNEVTGLSVREGSVPELRYPNGALAYRYEENSKIAPVIAKNVATDNSAQLPTRVALDKKLPSVADSSAESPVDNVAAAVTASTKNFPSNYIWLFGVAGISLVAVGGIFLARRYELPEDEVEKLAGEIEIVED